ncbi:hypothetical protein PUN28_014443 [Cardiocondyla obscurior]|uniref:Uncharacterized protein n=1 Tax=Cardiocondyla obscurior TaxID=286306 RepID=A0AAW2F1F8_9HYME
MSSSSLATIDCRRLKGRRGRLAAAPSFRSGLIMYPLRDPRGQEMRLSPSSSIRLGCAYIRRKIRSRSRERHPPFPPPPPRYTRNPPPSLRATSSWETQLD